MTEKEENILKYTFRELKNGWKKLNKEEKIKLFWVFSPLLLIGFLIIIWCFLRFGLNIQF